jgi:hypothetical protein
MTGTEILTIQQNLIKPQEYKEGESLNRGNFLNFALKTFGPANGVPLAQGFFIDFYSIKAEVIPTVKGTLHDVVSLPWPEEISPAGNSKFLTSPELSMLAKYLPRDEHHSHITEANIASKLRSSLKQALEMYDLNKQIILNLIELDEFELKSLSTNKFLTRYLQPIKELAIQDVVSKKVFRYPKL